MTSRELKFRVWDGLKNRMSKDVPVFCPIVQWNDGDIDMPTDFAISKNERFTFLQYTGLTDKSGKEIYEGDILNGRNQVLKIVYWCPKRAAFCESEQFKPVPAKHSFAKLYDKFRTVFNKDGQLINHEVIGNIYENPDLMK